MTKGTLEEDGRGPATGWHPDGRGKYSVATYVEGSQGPIWSAVPEEIEKV